MRPHGRIPLLAFTALFRKCGKIKNFLSLSFGIPICGICAAPRVRNVCNHTIGFLHHVSIPIGNRIPLRFVLYFGIKNPIISCLLKLRLLGARIGRKIGCNKDKRDCRVLLLIFFTARKSKAVKCTVSSQIHICALLSYRFFQYIKYSLFILLRSLKLCMSAKGHDHSLIPFQFM